MHLAQKVGVDTRYYHKTSQTIYKQKKQRIAYTLAELLNLVYVLECLSKFLVGCQKGDNRQKDKANYKITVHTIGLILLSR